MLVYLKLAGENTPIQSSFDGTGELYSASTHSVVCPYKSMSSAPLTSIHLQFLHNYTRLNLNQQVEFLAWG